VRRLSVGLITLSLAAAGTIAAGTPTAAAPDRRAATEPNVEQVRGHELPNPLEEKRRALREQALNLVLNGKAKPQKRGASTVVKVGDARGLAAGAQDDQYVELAREKTDRIFVILTEFGNDRHPDFPDVDTDPDTPGPVVFDGPLHNRIPEPNRAVDNSTIWQPDYNRQHFQNLYFSTAAGKESLATYYQRQSSGRYSVEGMVTDWVKVRYNQARYGRNKPDGSDNTPELVKDGIVEWVAAQKRAGRTDEQIRAELATFDVWDRYDYDNDGNFNERDGYIDHFQIVHAGDSESNGDPLFGEDAIWSHRSYAFRSDEGRTGPDFNKKGGAPFGDLGIWAGDYTVQPENGGLGVFAHEYGHDLGLPDHYDTSGGGENGVNWWTLMAQSRYSAAGAQSIGERAADLGAWDKLQLGWLDYEVAVAGQNRRYVLGPHEFQTANAQALVVVLPKKRVTTDYGKPAAGTQMWWSGKGDNLDNTLTRTLDLTGKSSAALTLKSRFDIEAGFDYLYVQASTDGGQTWTALDGTVGGKPFSRDGSGTPAIDGSSGGQWVDTSVPLDSLAGKQAQLRFRYRTDSGLALNGFFADEIVITADGTPVFTDGAESGANGWTAVGFRTTTGTETRDYDNYYLASNREYLSYDRYLQSSPYNFGFAPAKPDLVERFPYQDGLLVTYWDTSQTDNNTSKHPGQGEVLPVDSHPDPVYNLDGTPWRARIQGYDAPFGLEKADSFTLHIGGKASYVRGQAGQPVFDDTKSYWNSVLPFAGVKLPAVGVRLKVVKESGSTVTVDLSKK
jgi:immune inhibitor A